MSRLIFDAAALKERTHDGEASRQNVLSGHEADNGLTSEQRLHASCIGRQPEYQDILLQGSS